MNIEVIKECSNLSLAGKITFPEVVAKLASIGIERYHIDLVNFQKTSYDETGNSNVLSFILLNPVKISKNFESSTIKAAITDIQQQNINYSTFLSQIMSAGCSHYEVYIHGKKAIYFGRLGDYHVENFPNAN